MDITITAPQCPICGNVSALRFAGVPDYQYSASYSADFFRCGHCSHLFVYPAISDELVATFYAEYHTHTPISRKRFAIIMIYAIETFFSVGVFRPSTRNSSVNALSEMPPGRLLDVGCGSGEFVKQMRDLGWDAVDGIDSDPKAVEACKTANIPNIHNARMSEIRGPYKYLVLNHVIEHFSDPKVFMGDMLRLLENGGVVLVKTPNSLSLMSRIFGRYWRGIESPRHMNVFSIASLDALFRSYSFKRSSITTTNSLLFPVFYESLIAASRMKSRNKILLKLIAGLLFPFVVFVSMSLQILRGTLGDEIVGVFVKSENTGR